VIIQRPEWDAARQGADGRTYHKDDFDHGHPVLAIQGEHDLYGDGSVLLFPSYGHTPGHQCARVKLPKGDVVLAADCCYLKRSLDELRVSPLNVDRELSLQTLRQLRELRDRGTRIFYGHDGDFWRSLPQGTPLQ